MQFESDISETPSDEVTSVDGAVAEEAAVEEVVAEEAAADEAVAEEGTLEEDGPSVDALEDRLRDLQGAMDKIQSGDLDAAEQAIEALEQQMETARD